MAISAVSSTNQAAATLASQASQSTQSTQNLRKSNETQSSSRVNTPGAAPAQERSTTDVQENQRVQAPQKSVNTQGQTVGSTINITA